MNKAIYSEVKCSKLSLLCGHLRHKSSLNQSLHNIKEGTEM